jgi:uncharacterized protein (TIGR02453 family)
MDTPILTKKAFIFLEKLEKNNNKDWFSRHKEAFKEIETEVKQVYNAVLEDLKKHDEIEKIKMFRIYRDVRFSHDKTPYKTHFGGSFSRAGARLRGGYYLHLKPGGSFIATGFWEPSNEDLFRIRKEFEMDTSTIKEVIEQKSFKEVWGELQGDALKTAPKGFDKAHPDIDFIRKKQFIFIRNFTDAQVFAEDFLKEIASSFQKIRPYFDVMSTVLTTNLNGESLSD